MRVYSVLRNHYDYHRFTEYLGTYSSLKEAREIILGERYYVVMEGEPYFDKDWDDFGTTHCIIVIKGL